MYGYDITQELFSKMTEYEEKFNDMVPLMEIPDVEEKELIEKIEMAISENKTIFNYFAEMERFYAEEQAES